MGLAKAKDIESRFARYVEGLVSVIGHADRAGPLQPFGGRSDQVNRRL